MRLFIELYLDEDVSVLVARLVRSQGFVATTVMDEGQTGKTDAEQLVYAISRRKTSLTHNRADFEALGRQNAETGQLHCGIIIATRQTPHEITRRLLAILNDVTADEMENQLRYI